MTDRKTLDQMTSDDLDALHDQLAALREVARDYCPACGRGDAGVTADDWEKQRQRADQAEAAIKQVRALHQPAGVVAAAEYGNPPDCAVCGPNCWPCPTYQAVDESARTTANNPATSTVHPREHCGALSPDIGLNQGIRTECVLRPGHTGSHADDVGGRWWYDPSLAPKQQPGPAGTEETGGEKTGGER